MRIAVFCVGNPLMLDDGVGQAAYVELAKHDLGPDVDLFDVGCMSLDYLNAVRDYDLIVTVDAAEGTGHPAGTVLRYEPDDVAGRPFGTQSLHDLRLSDLFEAAALLGYEARGVCFGVQAENANPAQATVGLTPPVQAAIPLLVQSVIAEVEQALTS